MPQFFQPNPKLAFEPLHTQEAFALEALRHSLDYLRQYSPFYKEKLGGVNLSLQTLKDLQDLPFTSKEDMQARNMDFLCVPRSAIREYTATSGTMGKPVTIALTESDLQRLAYNEAQSFSCADGTRHDVCQLALTLDRQFMAGMAYYSGIRAMGAASVRTGPGLPALQLETAERLHSTCIVGVPSFLAAMADWAVAEGKDLKQSSVKKAVCIGEPLRNADFSLSALGNKLAVSWPALKCYSTYAATELQTAFTECCAGRGGHHQPDLIIVEIIDSAGASLPDGETGEVVITTLGIEAMPLLRYKTGDVAALHMERCACGRRSKRLGPIIGRRGQMIKYRGTTLYPHAILEVLASLPHILGSVVEAYTGDLGTDELCIHLHSTEQSQGLDAELRAALQSRLRVAPTLKFHTAESLQAIQMPPGARKAVRFWDRRKN